MSRLYVLNVPTTYDNTQPYKLVIVYHQSAGTAVEMYNNGYYHLLPLANNSAIFVAPDAVNRIWTDTNNMDTQLTDAIVAQLEQSFCIDPNRIFVAGWSIGAGMALRVASARPLGAANGFVRAAAVYSVATLGGTPSSPVAYYASHGTADTTVPYNMGLPVAQRFATANGCTWTTPVAVTMGDHVCTDMLGCMTGYPVRFCSFNGPHTADPLDPLQTTSWEYQATWSFLSQF
jgi:poly(3-hydroxybutyrate) depolymerase